MGSHSLVDKVFTLLNGVSAYAEHVANYFAIFSERGWLNVCPYFPSHYTIEQNIALNGVEKLHQGQRQLIYAYFLSWSYTMTYVYIKIAYST